MTALAGICNFASPDCGDRQLQRMLEAQARYGSDSPILVCRDEVAFGSRLTPLLPEDRFDRGPIEGGGGTLLLAADLRLDNRDELAAALGLTSEAVRLSDAALLLKAWERWQAGTPDKLVGAWAFALWDGRARHLLLARDPQGQRPLHYHMNGAFAAFASMPSGLHALDNVSRRIDRDTLARFVEFELPAPSRSFFEGVNQVPPGHFVTIEGRQVRTECFWKPSLEPIRLRTTAEYVDAVREQLDRAVTACLRGSGDQVGAHLSAGLDSGGVAATAARLMAAENGQVIGFTAVPRAGFGEQADRRVIADEGPLAAQTAAMYFNLDQILVRPAQSVVAGFDYGLHLYERPLPNPTNHGWASAILDEARRRNLRVLLTGQMGNLTFSHDGDELLPALLRTGRWFRLAREAGLLRRSGTSVRSLAATLIRPFLPDWSRRRAARNRNSLARAGARLPVEPPRHQALGPASGPAQARLTALELYDFGSFNKGILAGWGVDLRDPTGDRRLIEFCLRIPPEQFLSGGVRRALARRVLADRLPPSVANEARRGRQSADWRETLGAERLELAEEAVRIAASREASAIVDTDRISALVGNWPPGAVPPEEERSYRVDLLRALSAGHFARSVEGHAGEAPPERHDFG